MTDRGTVHLFNSPEHEAFMKELARPGWGELDKQAAPLERFYGDWKRSRAFSTQLETL